MGSFIGVTIIRAPMKACYLLYVKASLVFTLVSATAFLVCSAAGAASSEWNPVGWSVARSSHFEVYSQAGPERAKSTLLRFEELHAFFDRNRVFGIAPSSSAKSLVRIVEFRTVEQYRTVQLRPNADAYYSAAADRNYIVMPTVAGSDFSMAAHEYAHFVLHSGSLKLPLWLNEGLAELLSTVTIAGRQCELGDVKPAHVGILVRYPWLTAPDLLTLDVSAHQTKTQAAIFYAESWALTYMLTSAPEYAPHFEDLVKMLNSGVSSPRAFVKLYGKSPEVILTYARDWMRQGVSPRKLSSLLQQTIAVELSPLKKEQAQSVIADLLLTNGAWERAERIYEGLLNQLPNDPDLLASLGEVSLRKGAPQEALGYWRKALEAGLTNSALCYSYALLADRMNLGSEPIEQALERAIALRPDFDNARFKLAQLKSNESDYAAAAAQLQVITNVSPDRAFEYWTSLAYALAELGKRNESEAAAEQAKRFAANAEQYTRAAKLAYVAKTDMTVQFTRDGAGKLQLVTTRVPHGTSPANPFIKAEDQIQTTSGRLQEVQCSDGKLTGFLVKSAQGTLVLSVPDPAHVFIRKGPSEFTCGPQDGVNVKVEYATTVRADCGLLRGIEF